jgi:glucokinase
VSDLADCLLADIGGTNARFACLTGTRLTGIASYATADFPTPADAARAYLAAAGAGCDPERAAFAAAGPVAEGRGRLTNADWIIDGAALREALGLKAAYVLNDFEALAWSIPQLTGTDLSPIGRGAARAGEPIGVIGPGTGFGMAALLPHEHDFAVLVTEGGHATLASDNAREDALVEALRTRLGHVSIERALSGGGLVATYRAVAEIDRLVVPERDAAAVVSAGLSGECVASSKALAQFCAWLGGVAGNVALTYGARGGVYIGGGMVPRFVDFLAGSEFRGRFEAKGRLSEYLAPIPTSVIVHHYPALVGLARFIRSTDDS